MVLYHQYAKCFYEYEEKGLFPFLVPQSLDIRSFDDLASTGHGRLFKMLPAPQFPDYAGFVKLLFKAF